VGHNRQIHWPPFCYDPDLSRLFPVWVWILPFATFRVPVVLLPLPFVPSFVLSALNSHHNSGAAVTKIFPPPMFQQRRDSEVSRPENVAGNPVRAAVLALGQPARLHRMRVKRAESGPDRRTDPHDAFFHVWPKKGNPKITPEKQLWPAQRRWASGMIHTIVLHLVHCCCCIIHHATSARGVTALIHLPLKTREFVRLDVNFLPVVRLCEIGFSPIRESASPPIVRFIEPKVLFKP